MTNYELLLAMSEMMDAKLHPLQKDLQEVKTEVQEVKKDLQEVKTEVQEVKEDLQVVKDEVQVVKTDLQSVHYKIQKIKLFQENEIMPRLNTIESCYTSTYNRYRCYVEKMDAAFIDIDILKKVVSEHFQKLQKLA